LAAGDPRPPRSAGFLGGEQVEGRQAVRELLAARGREVKELWLTEGSDPSPILGEIDRLAKTAHVPVRLVSYKRLETVQMTEAPQGVVAFAEPLTPYTLEQLLVSGDDDETDGKTTMPFLVVAAGVTDPQNLGAIIRSAECAGATGIVIPKHRAAHVTAAVTKAAAGAVEHVRIALVSGIPSALQDLQKLGVTTVGLDERGSDLFGMKLGDRPVALVMGAEGKGLQSLVHQRCDLMARIPVSGSIPSLNVSAAAAVACFEVARQRAAARS
jgi:23S rRNA (guanosine2251-2'-O)-methyltransferase